MLPVNVNKLKPVSVLKQSFGTECYDSAIPIKKGARRDAIDLESLVMSNSTKEKLSLVGRH